jgi:homoserine dehydrogenase
VVVDVAVHGGTYDLDLLGVRNGSYLVLSNKGPLSGSTQQYEQLVEMLPERLWHEATVGAGMPIITTLDGLISGGDEILEIQASPSGTLGFVMSAVEAGRLFSEAVQEAVALAYAEPDPRDDLSGLDVARKAIILARKMGRKIEPEEIPYESLVPEGLEDVSLEEFMERLPEADEAFAERLLAVEELHMLRYLARIPQQAGFVVGQSRPASCCSLMYSQSRSLSSGASGRPSRAVSSRRTGTPPAPMTASRTFMSLSGAPGWARSQCLTSSASRCHQCSCSFMLR